MKKNVPLVLAAVGLAALTLGPGALVAVSETEPTTQSPPGTIAALSRSVTEADVLPAWFSESPAAGRMSLKEARLLGVVEGVSYYLVPGIDQTTCLISIGEPGISTGTCSATAGLTTTGIYFTEIVSGKESTTAIVLPDGYNSASADTNAELVGRGENLAVLKGEPRRAPFKNHFLRS